MFTQNQLDMIRVAAKVRKNQGPVAVYKFIANVEAKANDSIEVIRTFTPEQLNVLKYIAEECMRQHSGEMSVLWLANAWNFASAYTGSITTDFIDLTGRLIEPVKNINGFRTIPIGIYEQEHFISRVERDRREFKSGWVWKEKAQWERVPFLLQTLIESFNDGNLDWHYKEHRPSNPLAKDGIDQFYYEYEEIHPFVDGNGRSGKVIYNWMRGTLDNPVMPPNFFDCAAP